MCAVTPPHTTSKQTLATILFMLRPKLDYFLRLLQQPREKKGGVTLTSEIVAGRGGRTLKAVVRLSSLNRPGPHADAGCPTDAPEGVRRWGDLVGFDDACVVPACATSPEFVFLMPEVVVKLPTAAISLHGLTSLELSPFCRLLAWSTIGSSDPATPWNQGKSFNKLPGKEQKNKS